MKIIRTSVELNHWFNEHNIQINKSLGLVPTMGALHQGHASLIENASKECDLVVVSILVNPTQFNAKDDLDAYPRTMDADAEIAKAAGCNERSGGAEPKADQAGPKTARATDRAQNLRPQLQFPQSWPQGRRFPTRPSNSFLH